MGYCEWCGKDKDYCGCKYLLTSQKVKKYVTKQNESSTVKIMKKYNVSVEEGERGFSVITNKDITFYGFLKEVEDLAIEKTRADGLSFEKRNLKERKLTPEEVNDITMKLYLKVRDRFEESIDEANNGKFAVGLKTKIRDKDVSFLLSLLHIAVRTLVREQGLKGQEIRKNQQGSSKQTISEVRKWMQSYCHRHSIPIYMVKDFDKKFGKVRKYVRTRH